ncbi:MAG: hypothetical protein ABIH00_02395 [Armatimonadota bacterium]
MKDKEKINSLINKVRMPVSAEDIIVKRKKPQKISDKQLKNLIRARTRVLDIKEHKTPGEEDLAIMLIENLCQLKPPNKKIIEHLAKSFKKLEKLNPYFLPLIMGEPSKNFSILIYTTSLKKDSGQPLTSLDELKGKTIHFGNNKVMILLNTSALGFYSEDVFLHELLHVIDDIIVPNPKDRKKYFHTLINKEYDNMLHKISVDYRKKQKKAHMEFADWLKKNYVPEDEKEQLKVLKKVIEKIYYDKYKLWAADENLAEQIVLAKKFLGKEIGGSEEVFAYGVQFYLNPQRRKILKKRIPELYNLLKDIIIPVLKKAKPVY